MINNPAALCVRREGFESLLSMWGYEVHLRSMVGQRKRGVEILRDAGNSRFVSGLLLGLGGAGVFTSGKLPEPQIVRAGLSSDWKAVGRDIETAMKQYEREHA